MNLHPKVNFNRNKRRSGVAVTPGMPHWCEAVNARRPQLMAAEPPKRTAPKVTLCPAGMDHRYTVAPGDPVPSAVNAAECREWARR